MAVLSRRTLLAMIGTTVAVTATGSLVAEAAPSSGRGMIRLRGVVRFAASGPLPTGTLTIRLEEQGIMDKAARRIAVTTVRSSGRRRTVPFELMVPRASLARAVDPGFTVRLERNGRLIAINTSRQSYRGGREVSLKIEPILY